MGLLLLDAAMGGGWWVRLQHVYKLLLKKHAGDSGSMSLISRSACHRQEQQIHHMQTPLAGSRISYDSGGVSSSTGLMGGHWVWPATDPEHGDGVVGQGGSVSVWGRSFRQSGGDDPRGW